MIKVSVVVLNWNQPELTIACLNSLLAAKRGKKLSLEIILVDNCSDPDKLKKLKEYLDRVRFQKRSRKVSFVLMENKENLGFAQGNNRGIKQALKNSTDYIFILNNDTEIDSDCLIALIEAAETNHRIGIISPKIYYAPGFEFHKDRYQEKETGRVIWYAGGEVDWVNVLGHHFGVDEVDNGQYDQEEDISFATGCAFLAKREVFDRVGVFDKRFFLYLEDLDFSLRTIKAGFRILFAPKSIVYHKNAASSGGSGSALQNYYLTRNRLLFGFKHGYWKIKLFLLIGLIKILFDQDKVRKEAVFDFLKGNFGFKDINSIKANS
ncbi:MAG: glycosyltransferase family 2 protein [Candidatus Shapirobacteria bacterium]|nr:glycosyltransferase family 2 protein [Candidatus Shapirobacteria bacterium]